MDRKWMTQDRTKPDYRRGVNDFVQFAVDHAKNPDRIYFPCLDCNNTKKLSPVEVEDHLILKGIVGGYTRWIWHGETVDAREDVVDENETLDDMEFDDYDSDHLDDLLDSVSEDFRDYPEMFNNLVGDSKIPLYPGCTKFSKLSSILKLYNIKASNGWSDKSFTSLLELLKDILPEDNVLPNHNYEAKKALCSIGMSYERIHACPNDCILYRNEYADSDHCPLCKASRYKKPRVPAKVLWYFPIIPRFRRLFSNAEDAENLTWHATRHDKDDHFLRHPADSPQWKKIDFENEEFGTEERNLRLALSTDGMSPHGIMSTKHSTWPVVMVIYNLPPSLCMKRKYMMMPLLISGPKQPGNDIDVYLAPLIEDLKLLWDKGVAVFDAKRGETFNLKAMLFCTINDFPVYGNLSGYSNKGYDACLVCCEDTSNFSLTNCGKIVYMGHRRFLPENHRYRKMRKAFNGQREEGNAPVPLTGEQVFEKVEGLGAPLGKKKGTKITNGFKKRSIFFDLPYWQSLYVRHCLDVMHIEKNICDSLVGTLLNMPGKTKDGVKARLDLVEMGIRKKLAPRARGDRKYLPPACYTMSKKEKAGFE